VPRTLEPGSPQRWLSVAGRRWGMRYLDIQRLYWSGRDGQVDSGKVRAIESRRLADHKRKVAPCLNWGPVLQALQNPVVVVAVAELGERVAQFVQISKSAQPQQLLFEGSEEPLDAPVALGLADKGRRRFHTPESDLRLKVVTHIDAAVVVTEPHAPGYAGGERTELFPDRLPDRVGHQNSVRFQNQVLGAPPGPSISGYDVR